eukprot:13324658-Alexandrium_andersonii.AAC.1
MRHDVLPTLAVLRHAHLRGDLVSLGLARGVHHVLAEVVPQAPELLGQDDELRLLRLVVLRQRGAGQAVHCGARQGAQAHGHPGNRRESEVRSKVRRAPTMAEGRKLVFQEALV